MDDFCDGVEAVHKGIGRSDGDSEVPDFLRAGILDEDRCCVDCGDIGGRDHGSVTVQRPSVDIRIVLNSGIDLLYDGLRVDGEGVVDFSDCGAGEFAGGNIGAGEAEGCQSLDVSDIQVRKVDAEDERGMSIVDSEGDAECVIVIF